MTLFTIDLRADAAAEVARLNAARALVRPAGPGDSGDPGDLGDDVTLAHLEGSGAWVVTARSPALRRALGRRALLLWRVDCEDASGRIVESRLIAIAIALSSAGARLRRRAHVEALVAAMERAAVEMVERRSDEWRIAVERTTRAFATTRAARIRAIALESSDAARWNNGVFQPGLFDRRTTRVAHRAVVISHAIAPAAAIVGRPRLRLVVVP